MAMATATTEEKVVEALEAAEEKAVAMASGGDDVTVAEKELLESSTVPVAAEASFKEETYVVGELKESEKKALLEFKLKLEEAMKANAFLSPPPPAVKASKVAVEEEPVKTEEETKTEEKAEAKTEEKDEEEKKAEEKKEEEKAEASVAEVKVEEKVEEKAIEEKSAEETTEEKKEDEVVVVESEDDLNIWGIPLLHTKGDERTDVILLKFLRARDFKLEAAMTMLRETMNWRKEFLGEKVLEEEISSEFDKMSYYHGVDKEGHPVCYNYYGLFRDDKDLYQKTVGDEAKLLQFLRWRIQVLEKGINEKLDFSPGGVSSMVQVFDFKHSPGFVKIRQIANKAVAIFQDNYPELVVNVIYINVPWYFTALYSLYATIFTNRQKSKFVVARPGKVTETLLKYISADKIPVHYGGLSRSNDAEFEGVEAPVKELTVKAGEKQIVELLCIEEGGVTVVWDISILGNDVVYGEQFVPNAERGYTVIVSKEKKLGPTDEPIRNSFKATEPGKVFLIIDNTASRSKKLLLYRHTLKK